MHTNFYLNNYQDLKIKKQGFLKSYNTHYVSKVSKTYKIAKYLKLIIQFNCFITRTEN